MKIYTYFRLLRLESYIKNLFVFTPLFFDFQFDIPTFFYTLYTFILFSFLASSVYIFNDIFDIKSDQAHPVKKERPIASGAVSIKKASTIGVLLLVFSLFGAWMITPKVFFAFASYLGINILYNIGLKQIPILDIVIISFGFVIRVLAGSYATTIPASQWILIMTFLLSLFLGFSKRRADIVLADKRSLVLARNTQIFSVRRIDRVISITAIIMCIFYAIYTCSGEVMMRIGSQYVFITIVWVVLGVSRYILLIRSYNHYKDPTTILISDWKLQCIILLWIMSFIILKYG